MKITYDTIANAMYLYMHKGKIKRTIPMTDRLLVDVDAAGNILGIELLDATSQIAKQGIDGLAGNIQNGIPIEIVSGTPMLA